MPTPQESQNNIFDLMDSPDPVSAASTTTGGSGNIFDIATGGADVANPPKELPEVKSESNTLWGNAKAETVIGELGAGLQSGTRQVISTFPAIAGIAASPFDPGLAGAFMEWSKQIADGGAQRGVARLEDLTANPMSWARYVAGVTGEAVPFVLSIMGGAGAGSLLTGLLRKKGVDAASRALIESTAPAFGGAFATAAAIETGATAQELFSATGQVKPFASIAAGTAKGALESLFPMVLARQYGLSIAQGTDLYGRLLGTLANVGGGRLGRVGAGIAEEGITELLQEEVDIQARAFFDENYARLSPDAWSRRMNSMVAGGVGGGIFSSFKGHEANTALLDKDIRDAVGETPLVFGANVDETPSAGPDQIIRAAGNGLDATAGLAAGALLDQSLSDVDLRSRGLYAAVIPGRDVTFGTQDQANNDNDYYQGQGFVRLDPTKVTRGDVSASVEDLPDVINDPRVDFLNNATMSEASDKLASAITLKQQAVKASSQQRREGFLDLASKTYREALDLGARVEPFKDGQVVLRDQSKAASLASAQATVDPQISRASLLETKVRPNNGGQFYVMAAGSPKERKRPGGKAIDLENMSPDDVTGFPNRDLARQVIANQQISRKLDIASANARGIRFLPTVTDPKAALQELVNILSSMSQSVRFYKQKAPIVERFMKLVDQGLRIDVTPESQEFAVLRQVREGELVDKLRDEAGPEISQEGGTSRIVKQRATRKTEPKVSRLIGFADNGVEALFYSQFHNTSLLKTIVGELTPALNNDQKTRIASYDQIAGRSPILNFLRSLVKDMNIKTDFFVEIVAPGSLNGKGVRYIEDRRPLTEGGKPQSRSIIQIDPWFYGKPTEGGKQLRKNPERYARKFVRRPMGDQKNGDTFIIAPATGVYLKKHNMTKEQFEAKYPGATHFLEKTNVGSPWEIVGTGSHDQLISKLNADSGQTLAETDDVGTKESKAWKSTEENVPPPPLPNPDTKAKLSVGAKMAKAYGTPDAKMFTDMEQVTGFYTDFTHALGQIIVRYEWGNLTSGEMEMIQLAYTRENHVSRSLTKTAALARVTAHPILQRTLEERGAKSDLYNFEEWLFQNISRVLIDPQTTISPVQEFFNKVARNIKLMLEKAAKFVGAPYSFDSSKGKAAAEVQKWIENLAGRGRNSNPETPFLSDTTRDALTEAIRVNQEALKGYNLEYVTATPQKASTVQIRKLLDYVPKDAVEDRRKLEGLLSVADRHNTMLEWLLGIHQLADLNGHIEPLRRYVSLTRAMEDDALSWATMADERLRQAQKLPKVQQRAMWALMNELDQMSYLDQKLLKEGKLKPRWPTADELLALVRKHKLTKESFEVYKNIRTDYLSFLTQLEITAIRNAEETISDPVLLKEKTDTISGEIAQMRARPYFPHMRFGKYIVTVKDKAGQVKFFAAYDTQSQRDNALLAITQSFKVPEVNSIVSDQMSPHMQQFQGLPRFALEEVKKALGLDADGLSESQKKDRDVLEALTFDAAPINSFRHNLSERTNTPGYSMDGLRAYATYFARSARFVARMGYSNRLQESIHDVRRTASPVSKDSRSRIADYMQQHMDAQMNPVAEYATVRAVGFMWYFAFTPAAAFVNLSQVPMVTYPYLASKFPSTKRGLAGNALQIMNQNVRELSSWLKGGKVLDGPKQEALDEAQANRITDDGFAQELAAVSQGGVLSRTLEEGKFARNMRSLAQLSTYPFAAAERFNRSLTFRTAWDLAVANPDNVWVKEAMVKNAEEASRLRIDRGWTDQHIAAYIYAAQAVRDTQFEYSKWARPKLMSGARGVLFMFKTYLQNMLFFMFRANRGTQVRFMLLLFATAGLMGLPGAEDAEEIAKWLARKLGYQIDPQLFIRRMLKEYAMEGTMPDILLHGASRVGFGIPAALNGLGIPAGSADLSGSLSMGRLVPGLAAGLDNNSSNFTELVGDVTREVAGPVLGVPFAMYQSLADHSLAADDPKRWERAMPRALRDVTRSSRYLAEQRERDTRGATVVQFDPNDISDQMDALAVGLGFQPTQVTRQWDAIQAQREVQLYWKGQRKVLMDGYARASRLQDVEGKQDARAAIKEFNQDVPYGAMKITQDSLQKSMAARKREGQAKESRTPVAKGLQGVSRDVQKLFPEAPPPRSRGQNRLVPSPEGLDLFGDTPSQASGLPSTSPVPASPPTASTVVEQKRVR